MSEDKKAPVPNRKYGRKPPPRVARRNPGSMRNEQHSPPPQPQIQQQQKQQVKIVPKHQRFGKAVFPMANIFKKKKLETVVEEPVEEEPLEEEPLDEEPLDEVRIENEKPKSPTHKRKEPQLPKRNKRNKPMIASSPTHQIPPQLPAQGKVVKKTAKQKKSKPVDVVENDSDDESGAEEGGLLFSIESDEEYEDVEIPTNMDESYISEIYEVDDGSDSSGKFRKKQFDNIEKVLVKLTELSPHKTGSQYICPRFDVEKFNPRTRMKMLATKRIWEVNFADKCFVNMRRKDFQIKKIMKFKDLIRVRIDELAQQFIIILIFKNQHPYRLKFNSKSEMNRFYEVAKSAIPNNVVWSPELLKKRSKLTVFEFVGKFHYERNNAGQFVVEEKELINSTIIVSTKYDNVNIWVGSWNIENKNLPKDESVLDNFISNDKDLYALSLQNAEKKPEIYVNYLKFYFTKKHCVLIHFGCINGVFLILFLRKIHIRKISCINVFKKKLDKKRGAVIMKMNFNESPLLFVACHLVSGEENMELRNKNVMEINDTVKHFIPNCHHIFWVGDFEYRISLPPKKAMQLIKKKKKELLLYDQLLEQKKLNNVFNGYKEGEIGFCPTYKCAIKGKSSIGRVYYNSETPSYCDRILYKSYPGLNCNLETYNGVGSIIVSEHTPVYASFFIDTTRLHVSHFSPPCKQREIKFGNQIYVAGRNGPMIKEPCLVFIGTFLEKNFSTKKFKSDSMNPFFGSDLLPVLKPTKTQMEFLQTQHLRISLYDLSLDKEFRLLGYSILSLKESCGKREHHFKIPIYQSTNIIGSLIGSCIVV